MKKNKLTQGQFALVDDEDFEELSRFKWYAIKNGATFYAGRKVRNVNGKQVTVLMHRSIMNPPDKSIEIDHKNGKGFDNQRENLRACSGIENKRNTRTHKDNISGFKGVSFYKNRKKFKAGIMVNGKVKFLGYFDDPILAAKAYDSAARAFYGEFARTNFELR